MEMKSESIISEEAPDVDLFKC